MDGFDADVLIFAIQTGHPLGTRVAELFRHPSVVADQVGVGSVLLLPEVLSKPTRLADEDSLSKLLRFLGRLELLPVTASTARLAVDLGARYHLRTVDAVHLATAIDVGADRFITNNSRDFPKTIEGIAITYPQDLPDVT
jgi:predicted nucleic acid-binding protein